MARELVLAAAEEVAAVSEDGVDEVGLAVASGGEEVVGADVGGARTRVGDLEGEVLEEGVSGRLNALAEGQREDEVAVVAAEVAAAVKRDGGGLAAGVLEELEGIAEDVLRADAALAGSGLEERGGRANGAGVEVIVEDGLGEALALASRLALEDFAVVEGAHVVVAFVGLELHDGLAAGAVGAVARLELDEARVTGLGADGAVAVELGDVDGDGGSHGGGAEDDEGEDGDDLEHCF